MIPVKFASLIRELALIRSPERKAEIARLSKAGLARLPEATLVAVVRGWFELKADGHSDADILREIEGRREREYGEEPLPGDFTLESYTRYRLRLEHPQEPMSHDAIFVMQAVHRATRVIGGACEETEGATARGMRTGAWVILAYAVVTAVTQGAFGALVLKHGDASVPAWLAVLCIASVAGLLLGAIGYGGGASWGRGFLVAALYAELAVCIALVVAILILQKAALGSLIFPLLPAAGALLALAYVNRRRHEFATRAPA